MPSPGEVEDLGGEVMARLLQPALGYALLEGAVGYVGPQQLPPALGRAWTAERQKHVALQEVLIGVNGKYRYGTGRVLALSLFGFLGYFFVVFF